MMTIRARTSIRVAESNQVKRRINGHEKDQTRITKKVTKTMMNSRKMRLTRILHELTKMLNGKGNVMTSMGPKVEFPQ